MNGTLIYKVEFTLWGWIIHLLTESTFLRNIIKKMSLYLSEIGGISLELVLRIVAISGFLSGCLLFSIMYFIF